jgi:hypothetical protein
MKYYIGIDPDLRLLNAAVLDQNKKPLAIFLRRNKGGLGDDAVANAARGACRLVEDVIAFFVAEKAQTEESVITLVVESQNMQHAVNARKHYNKKIDLDDIRRLSQVTGTLMGAFSNLCQKIYLVQPMDWKKNTPDKILHNRIYQRMGVLGMPISDKNPLPCLSDNYSTWSHDKINPGDFLDINDSLGLALYGAERCV